jgi:hypothetical protein
MENIGRITRRKVAEDNTIAAAAVATAADLFENPPIADTFEERVQNAVKYNVTRNWTLFKSYNKAGISKSALNKYAKSFTLFYL